MSAALRFLRVVVVVAAGVGAWFGYDAFAAAQDSSEQTELTDELSGATAPWADLGLAVADSTWSGATFTTVQAAGDVERHAMTFDPETGRIQLSLFDPQGAPLGMAELDPDEAFIETPGGTWQTPTPDADLSESMLRSAAAAAMPPTLVDVVPEVVWPWAEVLDAVPGGDASTPTRLLTIRIYGGAFAAAEPALAAQWRGNAPLVGRRGRIELEIEIDGEGHVVALRSLPPDDDLQFRFGPAPIAPTFQAPFVD
jgi:hypothetical protein